MVKRYSPKAGVEHEGSAAKPHAEMGGNNHSSIRPQDAINEFLLEMIPVKTELTERFEQQKEDKKEHSFYHDEEQELEKEHQFLTKFYLEG